MLAGAVGGEVSHGCACTELTPPAAILLLYSIVLPPTPFPTWGEW